MAVTTDALIILPGSGETIRVAITHKKNRNGVLKVLPNGSVNFSVPMAITEKRLYHFLDERSAWIEEQLHYYEGMAAVSGIDRIVDKKKIQLVGTPLTVTLLRGTKGAVRLFEGVLYITCSDEGKMQSLFDKWWKAQGTAVFSEAVERLYPLVAALGAPAPTLKCRRMKTRWGSCNTTKKSITFNLYLLQASQSCVDYVVLHELTHLLYPDHGDAFHQFLATHMGDWKTRKCALESTITPGL